MSSFENTFAAMICASITTLCSVMPAQAGIQGQEGGMDTGLRRYDESKE
jgi:hypothetical protein